MLGRCLARIAVRGRVGAPVGPVRMVHQARVLRKEPDDKHPMLGKIQGNPRVMQAMVEAMQLLQRKGFVDPAQGRAPTFMEMMRMMNDAEVKAKFLEVQAAMKEEGISFSPSDLAAFMNGGGMGSKQQQAGEESTQSLFQRIGNSFKSGKD